MTDNNGLSPAEADTPGEQVTPAQPYSVRLEFTGSGSEYFRIWIVNLLLTLCTLGLYYPWAKVRRLRYFYGNTVVDGQPLGFHGEAKKMFKGFVLVAVLFACYSLADSYSFTASAVALVVIAALWPALFKSSMQFRLANTSWRGLRFDFGGTLLGAYRAVFPMWAPAVGVALWGLVWVDPDASARSIPSGANVMPFFLVPLGFIVLWPLLFWNLKNYQHSNYGLATQRSRFEVGVWGFYKLFFKLGVVWIAALLSVVLCGVGAFFVGLKLSTTWQVALLPVAGIGLVAVTLTAGALASAYSKARTQNLVWNHTTSKHIKFHSDLRFVALARLMVKNLLLIVCSLGLYVPIAAIAIQRMRLQAVGVTFLVPPDDFVASQRVNPGDTAGDAAGDVLGIDIGV